MNINRALVVATLALAMIASGETVAYAAPVFPSGVASRTLTPDGTDKYTTSRGVASLTVSAPASNSGGNLRRVYWPTGAKDRRDSTVCASWAALSQDSVQPGIAHRITSTRAVTVTRNVWAAVYWVLNVHTWNGQTFTQVAQFDYASVLLLPAGGYRPLPWRVCSRLIGSNISVKVWFPPEAEPSWSDASRVQTAAITAAWSGKSGWYAGHIPPGGSIYMTGLMT